METQKDTERHEQIEQSRRWQRPDNAQRGQAWQPAQHKRGGRKGGGNGTQTGTPGARKGGKR